MKTTEAQKANGRTNIVAVYGTLRRDCGNHALLNHVGYDHIGDGHTVNKHALVVDGLPYLFEEPAISSIRVEVYAVDNQGLKQLDRLERHPSWYCRKEIPIKLDGGKEITAWLYFQICGKAEEHKIDSGGDYKNSPRSRYRW